jgi:hypothetical protein
MSKLMVTDDEVSGMASGTMPGNTQGTLGEKFGTSSGGSKSDPLTEFRHSAKKVELPSFDGEDPAGWISRAEAYFKVQGTSPEVKVELAQLCMEGYTIHFFNSLVGEDETMTWESLKEALLERYGGHGDGDVYEQLTELKQTGTVEEYIMEFEYLTAQIPKLPEKQFRGYFIHGLKAEIKVKVGSMVSLGDVSRLKLLQLARAVEKEVKGCNGVWLHRGPKNGPYRPSQGHRSDWLMIKGREGGSSMGGTRSNFNGPKNDKKVQSDKRRAGSRERGFTHLSYNELMDRKQKGLCFKCGGPFHPMHQCPDKQLRLLVIEDEEEDEGEVKMLAVEVEEEEGKEEKGEISVLDLHHIAHENHQTMKFQGTIHGVEVLILIDSGASHNFISQKLVHHMDWPIEDTAQMQVKLGNGVQIGAKGRCKELEMLIGNFKIKQDVHLFELGGIDVVLGMEWLKSLGDTIINWKQQTMSFWESGKWITLKGGGGCKQTSVALQSILGKPKPKKEGVMWEIEGDEPKVADELIMSESSHLVLEGVMSEYTDFFKAICDDVLSKNQY